MEIKPPLFSLKLEHHLFRFSSAHFTVFSASHKENLHGHNYQVSADVFFHTKPDILIPFSFFKPFLLEECCALDEKILIPDRNAFISLTSTVPHALHVQWAHKQYLFPTDEVCVLPMDNVTVENLAWYIGDRFQKKLSFDVREYLSQIQVSVRESLNYSATVMIAEQNNGLKYEG